MYNTHNIEMHSKLHMNVSKATIKACLYIDLNKFATKNTKNMQHVDNLLRLLFGMG